MSRPKIMEITVKVELPNGKQTIIPVKTDTMAVFFDTKAVETILGEFYKTNKGHRMKRSEATRCFGKKIADTIFGLPSSANPDNDDIELDDQIISKIWHTEDEYGLNLPLLCKTPPCIIG